MKVARFKSKISSGSQIIDKFLNWQKISEYEYFLLIVRYFLCPFYFCLAYFSFIALLYWLLFLIQLRKWSSAFGNIAAVAVAKTITEVPLSGQPIGVTGI